MSSIASAWEEALNTRRDETFLKLPFEDTSEFTSYRYHSFFKRAQRVAIALKTILRMREGEAVAIFTNDPRELGLVAHGSWLAGQVFLPLPLDTEDELVVNLFNELNVKTVVFPPAASARIAGMFSRTPLVANWLVTGSTAFAAAPGIKLLEELLVSVSDEAYDFRRAPRSDSVALVSLSSGSSGPIRGIAFSQGQLVQAAKSAAEIYSRDAQEEDLVRCFLPPTTLLGLTHSYLVPLFSGVAGLVRFQFELKTFWEENRATGVTHVVLDDEQFNFISQRGKSRTWLAPERLLIFLAPRRPVSADTVNSFWKRFQVPVFTCYRKTEAGGVMSAYQAPSLEEGNTAWAGDRWVASSGPPLDGVEVKIVSPEGEELGAEESGEILIRSDQVMESYAGTTPGACHFRPDGFVHTGDLGFWGGATPPTDAKEENPEVEDAPYELYVVGRQADLIARADRSVNLARVEMCLRQMRAVEHGIAVGFSNTYVGTEVGAYVIPRRASNIAESDVLAFLRERLEWFEAPKVVVFGERPRGGESPNRAEALKFFDGFSYAYFAE